MIKLIALLKRRAGMSRGDFIDYYQTRHAPLIRRLTPTIAKYRRNFLVWEGAFPAADGSETNFDCVTEIWFASAADHQEALAIWGDPAVAAQIAADEDNVFDRGATRMFVVEERD